MRFLPIPANYYDDLAARFGLDEELLDLLREHQLLYDRSAAGEFLHFYTRRVGAVFFEVVQRIDGYDGYGADSAPVRLAAQARLDASPGHVSHPAGGRARGVRFGATLDAS
jgi:4-hydroxyphenylpyruvate dioxygenase